MARTTTFSRNGDPSGPPQSQSQSPTTTQTMNHYHDNPTTMTTNTTSATATAAVVEPSKISNILKAFQAATAVPLRGTISRNTNTTTTTTPTPTPPVTSFSERGFQKFTTTRYATIIAFGVFLLYLILGTVVFAVWMEDWDAIDAAYFTVTTFTTVGYGDLYPITKGQRIFAMFFVTIGIMIIGGVVLGVVMNVLFAAFEKSLRSSTNRAQTTFLKKFQLRSRRRWSRSRIGSGGGGTTSHHGDDDDDDDNHEEEHPTRRSSCRRPSPTTIKSLIHNLGLAALVFVPGIVIGHFEQWALYESIYYSIITATTVGYGDLSPKNKWTRFAACFYLPLCVTIMASLFSKITSAYLDKKTREAEKEFFQRRLSHQDIQRMDLGGDGTVNPEEFLIFMLVNMGKVDEKSIQQIQALFRDLDKDGNGYLDAQDLLLMTYSVEEAPPSRDETQPQDLMTRNVSTV